MNGAKMDQEKILSLLYNVVDEVNLQIPEEQRLEKSPGTPLSGDKSPLDSLSKVNLLVLTEQAIEEKFGKTIFLMQDPEKAHSIMATLGTLAAHILELLAENPDA